MPTVAPISASTPGIERDEVGRPDGCRRGQHGRYDGDSGAPRDKRGEHDPHEPREARVAEGDGERVELVHALLREPEDGVPVHRLRLGDGQGDRGADRGGHERPHDRLLPPGSRGVLEGSPDGQSDEEDQGGERETGDGREGDPPAAQAPRRRPPLPAWGRRLDGAGSLLALLHGGRFYGPKSTALRA